MAMVVRKHHLVEKDGTGIKAMKASFPQPFQSSRANFLQDATGEQGCSAGPASKWNDASWMIEGTTRH